MISTLEPSYGPRPLPSAEDARESFWDRARVFLTNLFAAIVTILLSHREEEPTPDHPLLEMTRFESPLSGVDSPAREHLRVVGHTLTLCGADARTWHSYPDGRLLPGKECPHCFKAAYSPMGVGEPELRLVA